MQEMGMNFKHQGTVDCLQNIEMRGFLILLIQNSPEINETWHAIMERHQHAVVKILSHLGQVWVCASHKPELLTISMMVFGRERPTFGDETKSIASYCFQFFSRVNIEQQECCVNFCDFSGVVWTFLCINWVFNAFYVHNSNLQYMHML